ncbi:MAG: hypothetical protein PHS14_10500, partial [Elusimicrobia bacterium]|nr:hypothetical protein [Elusimicrobiota bacterium]
MTTENSRTSFKPRVFLAAFGLALALLPTPAKAGNIPLVSSATLTTGADDQATAVARDGNGSLYAVGYSSAGSQDKNIWVSRWNESTLTVISSMTFNGTANGGDAAQGVAVDASGNVFVMGISSVSGQGPSLWMGKFTNTLVFVSSATYPITPFYLDLTCPGGIFIAPGGNIFVVSEAKVGGNTKILLAEISPSLAIVSSTTFFSGFNDNMGFGVTRDSAGNLYVAGAVAPAALTSQNIWVGKFNSSLVFVASATLAGGAGNTDQARSIALGPDGNIYVAGAINNAGVVDDLWIAKYSPGLNLLNSASYASPVVGTAAGNHLVATNNRLYVASRMFASGQADNAWIGEFDYGLTLLSSGTFTSAGATYDENWGLAVDTVTGTAYVSGVVTPAVRQIWVAKYQLPTNGVLVNAVSTAPISVDVVASNVPVIYADLTSFGGSYSLGTFTLNMYGDVPSSLLTASLWRDNGDGAFSSGSDLLVASAGFLPSGGGLPPRAMLNAGGEPALTDGTTRYFFTVGFNGAPTGRKLSFGFQMPADFGVTPNNLQLPFFSNKTIVRMTVFANPVNGVNNYGTPAAGSVNSGGLDTGIFVQAGQRVHGVTAPGDAWLVPGTVSADGSGPTGGLNGAFNRGLLVGRIGSGAWFPMGQVSTITATSAGTLYVAPNDTVYADNSGFVRVSFEILPSTISKLWLGGTLGFETSADINQNWAGGRPANGENVYFDSGAYDCDWNLSNVSLASLFVSTAYTGNIRLTAPPFQFNNRLQMDGDATIRGGVFSVGAASAAMTNTLAVKGRLVVRDTATLDMSGGALELGIGAEIRAGALLRASSGMMQIRRAVPSLPWYLRVDQATVNVNGSWAMLDGVDYLDFINATVLAFDNAMFSSIGTSTSPYARFASGSPIGYTFNNWNAGPPGRSPSVIASALAAGSTVTFNGSTAIGGTSFGSPNTVASPGVVHWIPDGGGASGSISGTLTGPPASYLVVASTSPSGVVNNGLGGGGVSPGTSIGPYSITGLRSPGTYYLFAYVDSGGFPVPFSPAGGFGHPGIYKSDPVFLPSGGAPGGINLVLDNWGEVAGSFNNSSNQVGPVIVETWEGLPNVFGSTRQASGFANPFYQFQTPASFGGIYHSSAVFAFVDANRNSSWDTFEASTTILSVDVSSYTQTFVGNFNILGGDPAPGGSVTLSTQAVHLGAIGANGPQALIRSRLTASGGPAELAAMGVRFQGAPLPNPGSNFGVWLDDGDGVFNPALDSLRGTAPIFTLGPDTYTVTFAAPVFLPVGSPRDFFVTLDMNVGFGLASGTGGVMIDAATSYALSAGAFSVTPPFPMQTGALPVLAVVRADVEATVDRQGGAQVSPTFFFDTQMISVTSTGTWRTGPGDAPTGPGGAPGTTGLNTVLPSANRGELIGRVKNGPISTPWRRIGTSTAAFQAGAFGVLNLAINDFVGAYTDNTGSILAGYVTSGSSVGAISGQVFYSTPTPDVVTVTARLYGAPMQSTSFNVTSSTAYPFVINSLLPGFYDLTVQHFSPGIPDYGLSAQGVQVAAGATSYLDAVMYQSSGGISGSLSYGGVFNQGDFHVGVATVTDFSGEVHFYGGTTSTAPGTYSIGGLPSPATYYVVAYRDANNNGRPDGSEPLGYFGVPGAGMSTLASSMTAVYLPGSSTLTNVNMTLQDLGAIEGSVTLLPGATGTVVVETGRGIPGSAGYSTENRTTVPAGAVMAGGVPYSLGLLRPATGYSVFAFLDKNFDGQPSAGEEQYAALSAVAVPSGGRARLDFSMVALTGPAAPVSLTQTPALTSVTFDWNLVPGATGYQLRRANNAVILSLGGAASSYIDSLPNNTSSQIRSITASNGNGTSTTTALSVIAYSLAATPTTPVVTLVTATGAFVTWGGTNPPGTLFELLRATTSPSASPTRVFLGTSTALFNPLAPASTYFWTVRAFSGGGVPSSFSAQASTVTLPLAGPSLSGVLTYPGYQTGVGRGFVIEASTSSTTFFPRVSSATLPGAPQQPWYLPVPPAGTYFVRAFVDVAGNGVLQSSADRGQTGANPVAASSVTGVNFAVVADTTPPGAPAGVLAVPGNGKVTLSWAQPTRNANGTPLVDLGGYFVERATAPSASFIPLTPVPLSSTTLSWVDNFPIPASPNFYRVRATDVGGNQSSPSGAVSSMPSSGGSISGQVRSFSGAAGGQYRVRLSTSPAASAPSVAEASLTSYTFTSLSDGIYYLRAFRDINGNAVEDALSEPGGTFGGLNKPFPIAIVNGNAVSGADATICDRFPLQPPFVTGNLFAGACPALDKGPGYVTNLYAISVGGGVAGSFGVGTQINLAMSTATAFATDIILLGPDGGVVARDNRVGGANLSAALTAPGIYIVEPTSFLMNSTGTFVMNLRLEGGFAGTVAGSVTYSGARPGLVYTQLFNSPMQQAVPIMTSTAATPGTFSFAGLPDGVYYIRSFRDSNGNGVRDNGEPSGQYGVSTSSSLPAMVVGGLAYGAPFIVPITDPAVGTIRGAALYDGTAPGALRVEAGHASCQGCSSLQEIVAFTTVAAGGVYTLPFLPSATDFVLRAFVDSNGNGYPDALESSISTFPITVFVNATSTVSLIVKDAGAGAFGSAIVVGTVTYSGASTGPILVGLSRDPQFRSVDYLLVLPATGTFSRAGLQGDATYYMIGFIDSNLNNSPDDALGEPMAAGSDLAFAGTPLVSSPPPIYVAATGLTTVQLTLSDPPDASLFGTVRYTGSANSAA